MFYCVYGQMSEIKNYYYYYKYVMCAMIIFCYLSITVGYRFLSHFCILVKNYMFTYVLYFII